MGNNLFLAMALGGGGGVSQATIDAMMAMRMRSYEKLSKFIKWLSITLVYAYYWLKKHPETIDETTKKVTYTLEGMQKFTDAFWSQSNQKDFVGNLVREGVDMILDWLKPDQFETQMWAAMFKNPAPSAAAASQPGIQEALLQAIKALGMSAPAGSIPGSTTNPPLGNLTPLQYFNTYGFHPPATTPPPAAPGGRPNLGGL